MKFEFNWWYASLIIVILTMFLSDIFHANKNTEIKLKQIEYCRELKIVNCPEVN